MPIINDQDFILLQVESLKKLLARLLNNNILVEEPKEILPMVEEGLKILNLSIDDLRLQPMAEIISAHPDSQILFLLDSFLDVYLQHEDDPQIKDQRVKLLDYLHEKDKTCSFTEFFS